MLFRIGSINRTKAARAALIFGLLLIFTYIFSTPDTGSRAEALNDLSFPDRTNASQSISTHIDDQTRPAIAYNSAQNEYLVVWEQRPTDINQDIYARRVSASGIPIGTEIVIAASSTFESSPDVAYNPRTDQYLVVWQYKADFSNNDLYLQFLSSDGSLIGGAVPIAATTDDELEPQVAAYPWADAGYLIVYQKRPFASEQHDIYGRIISQSGTPLSSLTIAAGVMDQSYPDLAAGEVYLVTWQMQDLESGDGDYEIHARSVSRDGSSIGGEHVLSNADYDQIYPKTAYDSNNERFVVVWEDHRWAWGDARDLYGQLLAADISLIGANFGVAWLDSNYRLVPDVTFDPVSDEYLVVYEYQNSPSNHDIYRRRVSSAGTLPDEEAAVSTSSNAERNPGLAAKGDGSLLMVWQDDRDNEQGWNIYGSIYGSLTQPPDLTVTNVWTQSASICYQLENYGGSTAPLGHSTSLTIDGVLESTHQVWQDLAPGSSLGSCFFDVWDCSVPNDVVSVSTDIYNQVAESNEANNSMQKTFVCDSTPPQITNGPQVTNITQHSATISWQTDELSDSRLLYSTTSGVLNLEESNPSQVTTHALVLNGLNSAQTYFYAAQSSDPSGNSTASSTLSFETLPPSDSSVPSVSLDNPGQVSGEVLFNAEATDDTAVEVVSFFLDGELAFMDYSAPYRFAVDTSIFDNGAHTVVARAVDQAGNQTDDSQMIDFSNLKDASWPSVQITSPNQGATVSGIVPVTAQVSDDTGIVSARLFINNEYQQFKTFSVDDPPTETTAVFDWDTRGLDNNTTYILKVVAYDLQGKVSEHSISVWVNNVAPPPPPSPPLLQIANQVVLRDENKFIVILTVKNVGDSAAHNINILYAMHGFQPIAKDYTAAEIRSLYAPLGGYLYADIYPKSNIPANDSRIYTFNVIPALFNPDPETPSLGFFISMAWDSATNTGYHDAEYLPVGSVIGGETIPEAHSAALKLSDYLIVTNPYRLAAIYNPSYFQGDSPERRQVNDVLSKMAELAYYQNGVLGYNTINTSKSLRELIKIDGLWSDQLTPGWTSDGYMLLVGEVEIVSSWSRNFGTVDTTKGEKKLILSYTDYPYANTFGDEIRPELIIARIIGNSPQDLSTALDSHIQNLKGTPGFDFEGAAYYLASGFNRGIDGGASNIDFLSERNKLANKFGGTQTLLHTPDLSIFDPAGELDISATNAAITNNLLSSFPDKDIIFLAGHGGQGSWDSLHYTSLDAATNPFGDTIPFVFASSCDTAMYAAGDSLAESFLKQSAGAYLGAIHHGLCPNGDCPGGALFASKWNPGMPFAMALRDTKRLLWFDLPDRWWVAIYHLFGDAKFGTVVGYLPPSTTETQLLGSSPSTSVEVNVPDYEITLNDYGYKVTIPDGLYYSESGKPSLPVYQALYEFPAGIQVQDVVLLDRSSAELISDLILPATVFAVPENKAPIQPAAYSSTGWWPEQDFEWLVTENPLTTTLTIRMYPFVYNGEEQAGRFYDQYTFEIQTTSSSLEITGLETGAATYHPGQIVDINLTIQSDSVVPEDIIVSAVIQETASGEFVDGLLLETLDQFAGLASFSPKWDTSGFPSHDYSVYVELRDKDGLLLDQQSTSFQVGERLAQITNLIASHQTFEPGMQLELSVDLQNNGDVPVLAALMMDIHAPIEGIIKTFSLPEAQLLPGETKHFETDWNTSGLGSGSYDIVAYAKYGGATTEALTINLQTNPKIYLPVIYR